MMFSRLWRVFMSFMTLSSRSVVSNSEPHGLQHTHGQASLSIISSQNLLKLMSIESLMPSNCLILSSPSPPAFSIRVFWVSESDSVVSDSLQPHGLYSPWNSPGQNTGVGSLSLLQGIFPTQGSNLGLWHCRRVLYQLSHKETQKYWSGHYPKVLLFQILNQGLGNLAITYSLGRFQSSL